MSCDIIWLDQKSQSSLYAVIERTLIDGRATAKNNGNRSANTLMWWTPSRQVSKSALCSRHAQTGVKRETPRLTLLQECTFSTNSLRLHLYLGDLTFGKTKKGLVLGRPTYLIPGDSAQLACAHKREFKNATLSRARRCSDQRHRRDPYTPRSPRSDKESYISKGIRDEGQYHHGMTGSVVELTLSRMDRSYNMHLHHVKDDGAASGARTS